MTNFTSWISKKNKLKSCFKIKNDNYFKMIVLTQIKKDNGTN